MLYRDFNVKTTTLYRLTDGEWKDEIREDLENILSLGIKIESVTCDGLSNIAKSVKKTCKDIIIQRCLVHIQRECLIWLTQYPRSDAAVHLRSIVSTIHTIKSHDDRDYWISVFNFWKEGYNEFINEKSYSEQTGRYWYKHKMVRKSFVHIRRALPYMFHYLDNPNIPNKKRQK